MQPAAREAGARLPLSAAQYGIWLGQQLDPSSPAYWTAEALELRGALDEGAFEAAVRAAVAECDALHMRYTCDGEAVWQALDEARAWPWRRLDLGGEAAPLRAALDWARGELARPADLALGPLVGGALIRLGVDHHLWVLRAHHVALDGFGYNLITGRVAELYTALRSGARPPTAKPSALGPVVEEDRAYRASEAFERARAFWRARLSGAPEPALLAPPRPLARGVLRSRGELPAEALARWRAAAEAAGADWASWLFAAVAAWLHRATGATDFTLGLPVMSRLGSVALTVPCMAMNIVPLRVRVDEGGRFADLARQVAAELRAMRPHQRYRYEDIKHDLGISGASRRLFGPVVNLMPFDRPRAFGGLDATLHPVSAGPVEDLAVTVTPKAACVRLDLEANPDAYDEATLAGHRGALIAVLDALAAAPDLALRDVPRPAAPSAPRGAPSLLSGGPLPDAPAPVLSRLREAALAAPDRMAVEQDGAPALTYDGLVAAARRLAGRLRARGVGEGSRVVVLLPRAPDTIAAMIAVLWAGGGYLPLDPEGPPARIAAVLGDAEPTLVVTRREHADKIEAGAPALFLDDPEGDAPAPLLEPAPVAPDALAYVIYTSGSTGRPNGVRIGRDALAHFVAGASARYGMRAGDRVLQFAPLQFDASVEEIFLALANGATLVLRTDAMMESLPRFLAECARLEISVLDLPTAFWHEIAYCVSSGDARLPASVRLTIIGGEAALAERVARFRAAAPPHVVLLNTYGPTEATVVFTTAELAGPNAAAPEGDNVSIGRPLPGLDVAVVDAALRPVPQGEPGELCLIGPSLALGYVNRDDVEARRFVRLSALPGSPRAYRTGDRVRVGHDGELRFLGRLDDEVKISGHRVDPAEIETALLDLPGVREAAVVCRSLPGGIKRLSAFIVGSGEALDPAALRAALAARLPAPAIPASYAFLDHLPRDPNGKIDRKALRDRPIAPANGGAAVATPMERSVLAVFGEVLGVEGLTLDSDFFELGGRSLQALQAAHRLQRALQREVPVSALFRNPTVAALAQSLAVCPAAPPPGLGQDPLSPLLTLQSGQGPSLICIHPADGLSWCYFGLTRHLPGTPIHALQARGITGEVPASFDAMIGDYLALIRGVQPEGPYRLLGWSSGGGIAHALAAALRSAGHAVTLLAMLDAYPADIWEGKPEPTRQDALVSMLDDLDASAYDERGEPLSVEQLLARLKRPGSSLSGFDDETLLRMADTALHSMRIYRAARHPVFDGDLLFFHARQRPAGAPDWRGWAPYVGGRIERVDIDCGHLGMCQPASLSEICRTLAPRLRERPV